MIKRQDTRPKILLQNAIHHASKRSAPMSGGHDGDPEAQLRLAYRAEVNVRTLLCGQPQGDLRFRCLAQKL